jgi:hypothetical protein
MAGGMKRLAKDTAVYGLSSILGRILTNTNKILLGKKNATKIDE